MEFLLKKPAGFFQRERNQFSELVVASGSSFFLFSRDLSREVLDEAGLMSKMHRKPSIPVLLSAPFVYSFFHETIPLKKPDLKKADTYKLGFSRFGEENREVFSIIIDENKAYTIHSHMSDAGIALLQSFRDRKTRLRWKPFLPFVCETILSHPSPENTKKLHLHLMHETLSINRTYRPPKFHHFYHWNLHSEYHERVRQLQQLFKMEARHDDFESVFLDEESTPDSFQGRTLNGLLFPEGETMRFRSIKKNYTNSRYSRVKKGIGYGIVAVSTLMICLWTLHTHFQLSGLKKHRFELTESVKHDRQKALAFKEIAEKERRLIKTKTAFETAQLFKTDIAALLKRIEGSLPETSWIKEIALDGDTITLILLDEKSDGLSDLMKSLSESFEDIRLEEKSAVSLEEFSLTEYRLSIATRKSGGA